MRFSGWGLALSGYLTGLARSTASLHALTTVSASLPRATAPRPGRACCAWPAVVRRPAAQSLEIGDVLKVLASN